MHCPNCGFENESGSRFCKQCGSPLAEAPPPSYTPPQPAPQTPYDVPQAAAAPPYAPPQATYDIPQAAAAPSYAPPQATYNIPQAAMAPPPYPAPGAPTAPRKKGKTALVIGICACVLVLAGIAAALALLLPSGPAVQGDWVSTDAGVVLSVDDDSELTMYSLAGTADADYDFDKKNGTGSFKASGVAYEFTVDKDTLKLTNTDTDDTLKLSRSKDEPDIESVVTAPLLGLWTNEEAGVVLEINEDGKAVTHSISGDFPGTYDFNVKKGDGVLDFDALQFGFTSDGETILVDDVVYSRASAKLDIEAFISEHSNPLLGVWYDPTATYGSVEFFKDGTYTFTVYGVPASGTYTFDSASGTGEIIAPSGDIGELVYADGVLTIGGTPFTKEYVEQPAANDLHAIVGIWYESTGRGFISFYDDGTFDIQLDSYYYGSFTFNSASLTGTVTTSENETLDFYVIDTNLYLGDAVFVLDSPGDPGDTGALLGTWYDMEGAAGTLDIHSDGSVVFYTDGMYLYGGFEYDSSSGTGTMSLESEGSTLTIYFYLENGTLTIMDEAYENFVIYTQDYVPQP